MTEINLLLGDITKFRADAIVTAANRGLIGGGGVDGAIHSVAGPKLLKSLIKFKGCNPGDVVVTEAFELDAKFIIHAVGPIYAGEKKNESELLFSTYYRCIEEAKLLKARSILFPVISTGAYGYPFREAALIALQAISVSCKKFNFRESVSIVCFDKNNLSIFQDLLKDSSYY